MDIHTKSHKPTIEEILEEKRHVQALSNMQLSDELRVHWDSDIDTSMVSDKEVAQIKKRIMSRIDGISKLRNPSWKVWLLRAAVACIVVTLSISTLYFYHKSHSAAGLVTMSTGVGEHANISLPDGTVVRLNNKSVISYHASSFGRGNRNIRFEGEGYFKVAKDKDNPFTITTKRASVTVLGTIFNLKAYGKDTSTKLCLEEGSVRFLSVKSYHCVVLNPGDMVSMDNSSGRIKVRHNADSYVVNSWMRNEMMFQKAAFQDVIAWMSENYNKEISVVRGPKDSDTFSGTLPSNDLHGALAVLIKLYHLRLTEIDDKVILSGHKVR